MQKRIQHRTYYYHPDLPDYVKSNRPFNQYYVRYLELLSRVAKKEGISVAQYLGTMPILEAQPTRCSFDWRLTASQTEVLEACFDKVDPETMHRTILTRLVESGYDMIQNLTQLQQILDGQVSEVKPKPQKTKVKPAPEVEPSIEPVVAPLEPKIKLKSQAEALQAKLDQLEELDDLASEAAVQVSTNPLLDSFL